MADIYGRVVQAIPFPSGREGASLQIARERAEGKGYRGPWITFAF